MLVAGGAAYAAGRYQGRRRAEEDAYQDEPQYEEAPPAPPPPAPTQDTQADEIQRLADMHAAGNLTDEEFAAAKAKVLGI
jgi:hypothetical protein